MNGKVVEILVQQRLSAGCHVRVWQASRPAGIYLAELHAGNSTLTRKIIRMK